ncbi:MAG: cytochrome c-type biogenesis protein [Longimicrobiales bacterium]
MRLAQLIPATIVALSLVPVAGDAQTSRDTTPVIVEETRIDVLVREVASDLRCVVCQGLSLQDSPSSLAQNMRAIIREQLEAGKTPEEVKQHFVASYGEFILLEPEARGFNLTVYVLPVLALILGAIVIAFSVRRWSRSPANPSDSRPDPDPELAPWPHELP